MRAQSAHPNMCDICDRKLWLSVGGAFSQLLARSGYKRELPCARNLISQRCAEAFVPVSNVSLAVNMASLTLETATKPSATSGTLIKRNRYKLEVEILPTAEGLVSV